MRASISSFVPLSRRTAGLILLLFLATFTCAQITPSDDAYIDTTKPTTNYGSAVTLDVKSPSQTAYITFDLSSIPSGYTGSNIAKASLKLYVNAVTTAGSFNVDYVNGAWAEKTIDASNAPPPGATITASVPLAKTQALDYVIIDVTSAVEAWLNGTEPNYGLALVANSGLSATFDSKESKTQSHPPELDVVFTGGGGGGTITGVLTGAGSGLQGGGTSGTLNLSLLTSCANGQVLAWSGSSGWTCTPISGGGGTVTSVGLSAPSTDFIVTGSPVTTSGTLGLGWITAPDYNNTPNAIVKRDSSGNFSAGTINAAATGGFNLGGHPFAFGSYANNNAFVGFAGNTTTTGVQNTAVGAGALISNTTGQMNTATGYDALQGNTQGQENTATGYYALPANTTGYNNTATGAQALGGNLTGTNNTATGIGALMGNTKGSYNTAAGDSALQENTTGGDNTATGDTALLSNTTGSYNTAYGSFALMRNVTGTYNTAVGYGAGPDVNSPNLTNATAIGANAVVSESNALVLGGTGSNAVKVGIGTATPAYTLDVQGSGRFTQPITFASGQTFPGSGTVTSVGSGAGLTGGPITTSGTLSIATGGVTNAMLANPSLTINPGTDLTGGGPVSLGGAITLNLDTTKVPQLAAANTFTNNQSITGSLSASGWVAGAGFEIGSNPIAFGSHAINNAFLGFAGNTTMTGGQNTGVGAGALLSNTTGSWNTAIGHNAMFFNTTGVHNIAMGEGALAGNIAGNDNTGLGVGALFNTTTSGNTAIGSEALYSDTTGSLNTVTGYNALSSNTTGTENTVSGAGGMYLNITGSQNTATGKEALWGNTSGGHNTANGAYALYSSSTGYDNTATGFKALYSNTAGGNNNTATGSMALFSNTTGTYNTANGFQTLYTNSTGSDNTAVGYASLYTNNGLQNSGFGDRTLTLNDTGNYNTATGYTALYDNVSGTGNTGVGWGALYSNTTGNYLTCIGYNCSASLPGLSNATAIGAHAVVGQSNSLVLGGTGEWVVNVGIGTTTPSNILTIGRGLGHPLSDSWETYSSRRWKTNIHTLRGALGKIEQLRGVSYDRKDSGKHEIGVIAEEVGAVLPEVVTWEKNGKDAQSVDYARLTALLIEATKEQQALIHQQQQQIRAQQAQIEAQQELSKLQQAEIARLGSQIKAISTALKFRARTDSQVRAVKAEVKVGRE